jgi:choline dehydrogenase-like flavoprotein
MTYQIREQQRREHTPMEPRSVARGGWSWMTSSLFPAEFAITLVKGGERMWGADLLRRLRDYPSYVVLGTEGECLAYAGNRVELSDETDEFGVPRPKVTFDYAENEKALREEIHRVAREIFETAGARMNDFVISEGNDHAMGGCRMGGDPSASVVDRNLQAHDHPNLFVCDASVFPTPGGAQPSQTIMALATRLARHLDGSREMAASSPSRRTA